MHSLNLGDVALGEITKFLEKSSLGNLAQCALGLAIDIPAYTEEGKHLAPSVYVTNDLVGLQNALPQSEFVSIGSGKIHKDTALQALKKCALLAQEQWSIYLAAKRATVSYGVFRSGELPYARRAEDILLGAERPIVRLVGVSRTASEFRAWHGRFLIQQSHDGEQQQPVDEHVRRFCQCIMAGKPTSATSRPPGAEILTRVVLRALHEGHGTLAVATDSSRARLKGLGLEQGIWLQPMDMVDRVMSVSALKLGDTRALSDMQALESLIRGYLCTDGVTIFSTEGKILGYNFIVSNPSGRVNHLSGGRRLAYERLKGKVGRGVNAVLFRSQDGRTECSRI